MAVVTAVLVALVVGGLFLARMVTGSSGEEGSGPELVEDPVDGPARTRPSPRQAAGAVCWNEATAGTVTACSAPTPDERGLRWVFPSLDSAFARCENTGGDNRVKFDCAFTSNKGAGTLRYSAWPSVERSVKHYDSVYPARRARPGHSGQYLWVALEPNEHGLWRLSVAYASYPFGFSVESSQREVVEEGLRLVRSRSLDTMRGVSR